MGRVLNTKERQRLQQYLLAHPKCPAKATARLLGVARSTILEHKKLLGINPQREKAEADKGAYKPTLEKIRLEAAAIRENWTDTEEYARRVTKTHSRHYDQGTVDFPEYAIQQSKHSLVGFKLLG